MSLDDRRCPKCGGRPFARKTQYGTRTAHCDLVGWDGGPMVDKRTRDRRIEFHSAFDSLWKSPDGMSRSYAYQQLAEEMGLPGEEVHGKLMDFDRLGLAIAAVEVIKDRLKDAP